MVSRFSALAMVGALAWAGCTCAPVGTNHPFACTTSDDCADGFSCQLGECKPTPDGGLCVPGQFKPCAVSTCRQACGEDGIYLACAPTDGPDLSSNPNHCGACGRTCFAGTCINSRCTCVVDADCPSTQVCAAGGVCVDADDACGALRCPSGQVCRLGSCSAVSCSSGCVVGEVCDSSSNQCRPIQACRLPVDCGDGGTCEGDPRADGQSCNDGVACTYLDVCKAGVCSGTTYSCPGATGCQASACAGDGGCMAVNQPDGTACDDLTDCTFDDHCKAGVCGGTSYVCVPDLCAATSACVGDGGCAVTPRNAGAACDDGNLCTLDDTCDDAGTCSGSLYTCAAPGACQAAACAGDGGCLVSGQPDGTSCSDGLACTANDMCTNGVCSGTVATTYRDTDSDGVGDSAATSMVCPSPAGYVAVSGDCNDADPDVYQLKMVAADVDQDGVTASTALTSQCVGASSVIAGRTYYKDITGAFTWLDTVSVSADCLDTDADVFQMVSVIADADQDGYAAMGSSVAARCVGNSQAVAARTYYRSTSGAYTWLDGTQSLVGGDCDDADAAIHAGISYYLDGDGDGFGAGTAVVACTPQAGRVTNNTDCNDGSANVFTSRLVYSDADHDGWTDNAQATQCTGSSSVINGRTYYSDAAGAFTWVAASLGADCNVGNGSLFQTVSGLVRDNDRDGYPPNNTQTTACVGASSTVAGRQYYAASAAPNDYYLQKTSCINYTNQMGGNCNAPFDCYDLNNNAHPLQGNYFANDRGDGSFDYDCSSIVTSNTTANPYCATPGGSQTFYSDAACTLVFSTATVCTTTAAFALPGACGKFGVLNGMYYNPGVCTAASRLNAVQVLCR